MGMAVRPIFGEETVFANAVRRAGAMISNKFNDVQAETRCLAHLEHGGALNGQHAACM
jgi:hypothetical protein